MPKARNVLIQKSQRAKIHEWAVEKGNDQGPTIETPQVLAITYLTIKCGNIFKQCLQNGVT